MTFLHPALLAAGLAAISIPIIIHLLMHRRRKPVMWGAMRFLLEAYKRQRRKLMVEKWLLLACRCLILALLAFAIGRPLLGALGTGRSGRTVYLVIDNALAAQARDADGRTAMDRHKVAAKVVLDALRAATGSESDRVGLIALGAPAETIVVPASANLGSLSGLIDAIQPADGKADFAGAMGAIASALAPTDDKPAARPDRTFVVLLSDFLEGSLDPAPGADAGTSSASGLGGVKLPEGVRLVALSPNASPASNVSIVGVEPLRSVLVEPGVGGRTGEDQGELTELVRVQLRRTGPITGQAATTTVRARLAAAGSADSGAESPTERATVRWSAGQDSATAIVPIRTDRRGARTGAAGAAAPPGSGLIIAGIDDDALSADNRFRRPVELRDALRVGVVAPLRFARPDRIDKLEPAAWAKLALAPAGQRTGVDAVDIEPASLDAARLAGLDAVVLPRPDLIAESAWPRLKLFIESGGLVIVAPPPGLTVHLWGDAMTRGLGLPFTPAREAIELVSKGGPGKLVRTAPVSGDGGSAAPGEAALLALVEGELDELIRGVNVLRLLPLQPAPEHGETVLSLEDRRGIVMWAGTPAPLGDSATPNRTSAGAADARGLLVYLGVALDLEWSDLPARPLMVPLMQEVLRQGVGRARGSWAALAGQRPAMPSRTDELQEVQDPAKPAEGGDALLRLRVDASGALIEPLRRAGIFRAIDDRGSPRGVVAVNPDPRGGRTTMQTQDAVGAILRGALAPGADAGESLLWIPTGGEVPVAGAPVAAGATEAMSAIFGRTESGSPIALPLLIAALALVLIEVFVARRASHAELGDSGNIITPDIQGPARAEAA